MNKVKEIKKCIDSLNIDLKLKKLMKGVIIEMNKNEEYWGRWYDPEEEEKKLNNYILRETKEEGYSLGSTNATNAMVINLNNQGIRLDVIAKAANLGIDKIKDIIKKSQIKK